MNKIKKMYEELLEVYNKYSNEPFFTEYEFNDVRTGKEQTERHLKIFERQEKFGIKLKHTAQADRTYFEVGEYRHMSYFKDAQAEKDNGCGCYISRSDDGRQLKDERLFGISFPTGAYIFGDDYPTKLFQEFFNELKSYNPTYLDTTNNTLYWSLDSCKEIYNKFDDILQKYNEKNKEDYKIRKRKKLEEELELFYLVITINEKQTKRMQRQKYLQW